MRGGVAALAGSLEFPFQLAGSRVNRIEVAVETPEINRTRGNSRRRRNAPLGFEFPSHTSSRGVQRVKKMVAASNVKRATRTRGRRKNLALRVKLPLNF